MKKDQPNPGSDEALKAGCKCPVVDNHRGWGYWGPGIFVMAADCPLHGGLKLKAKVRKSKARR